MEKEKKQQSAMEELLTVTGIAALVAAVMTLLSLVPPLSGFYRWLEEREMRGVWTVLVSGIIGGVLGFYQAETEKE